MLAGVGLGTGLKGLGCVSRSLVVDVKRLHGLGVDVRNVVWDVTLGATVSVSTGLGANSFGLRLGLSVGGLVSFQHHCV